MRRSREENTKRVVVTTACTVQSWHLSYDLTCSYSWCFHDQSWDTYTKSYGEKFILSAKPHWAPHLSRNICGMLDKEVVFICSIHSSSLWWVPLLLALRIANSEPSLFILATCWHKSQGQLALYVGPHSWHLDTGLEPCPLPLSTSHVHPQEVSVMIRTDDRVRVQKNGNRLKFWPW